MSTALQEWIHGTLRTLVPESGADGAMHRFEVWHYSDDAHERIRIFRTEDRDESLPEMPLILASEIQRVCEQHANSLTAGTSARFGVQAFRGRDDTVAEATHVLVLVGTMVPNPGNSIASERGQLIRHNETLHSMAVNLMNAVAGRLSRDLEEEREARRTAERRFSEVIMLREEMLDRKAERDLEAAREARDAARQDAMLQLIAGLAPAVISRIGSKTAEAPKAPNAEVPLSPAALRDQAVAAMVRNLSGDEIQRIAMAVSPETQVTLLSLIEAYREDAPTQKTKEN